MTALRPFQIRILAWLCLAPAAFLSLAAHARADAETYRNTLRSTAWVLAKNSEGTSSGTGVLVDYEKKLLVTNAHVVGDARAAVVFFPEIKDGKPVVEREHYLNEVRRLGVRGQVVGVDRKRDLALVELQKVPEGVRAIEMAAESVSPGEEVESIGNPGTTDALWVYTSGTVRAVYKKQFRTGAGEHDFRVVETQSPINSGDSGGPVVNGQGQLVAISQAMAPKARLVSYFVDIVEIKDFLAGPWKPAPLPITDVLSRTELEYTEHETGHFEVAFGKDGEKQSVFITKEVEYYERADVRKIWSLAATTSEAPTTETALKLLQLSARTKLGAWAIERTEQGGYLVIYCVKIDATATPDAVRSTMQYVAELTRTMKKDLLPKEKAETATDTLEAWLGG